MSRHMVKYQVKCQLCKAWCSFRSWNSKIKKFVCKKCNNFLDKES